MNSLRNHRTSNFEAETIDIMKRNLLESFQQLQGIERCGVLFSGGVDSSLAAMLTQKFCNEVTLLSSCAENSRDSQFVSRAAEILDLKLIETRMSPECVWKILPELIYAIARSHRMDVEIALPFFLSSKEAKKREIKHIVSGQGPDELFGGYARHAEVFKEEGEESLRKLLYDEISRTWNANIERDTKAIAYNGVKAYFPYLDAQFVKLALSIPVSWKIEPNSSPSRKVIFRKLAINIGLPAELAMKPKDATQYSSGSSKILIDSVMRYVLNYKSMSRKKANTMVQNVLDIIASELGLTDSKFINKDIEIDLEATNRFLSRI